MKSNDYSEPTNDDSCSMSSDLKEARAERDAEQPMPSMTSTEELMKPGTGEVEG
jgi:hypothetical protein